MRNPNLTLPEIVAALDQACTDQAQLTMRVEIEPDPARGVEHLAPIGVELFRDEPYQAARFEGTLIMMLHDLTSSLDLMSPLDLRDVGLRAIEARVAREHARTVFKMEIHSGKALNGSVLLDVKVIGH